MYVPLCIYVWLCCKPTLLTRIKVSFVKVPHQICDVFVEGTYLGGQRKHQTAVGTQAGGR